MNGDVFVINNRFYIDPILNRFRDMKTGMDCRIEPRIMAVLCSLSQRPGELVTREQLVTVIWNDYGGGNEGLSQAVSFLRKLLDDQDKQLIRTIPKKGYQLFAAVTSSEVSQPKRRALISGHAFKIVARTAVSLYVIATTVYFAYPDFFKAKATTDRREHLAAKLQSATPVAFSHIPVKLANAYHSTPTPQKRITANLNDAKPIVYQAVNKIADADALPDQKNTNDVNLHTTPQPVPRAHIVAQPMPNPVVVIDTVRTPARVHIHARVRVHYRVLS